MTARKMFPWVFAILLVLILISVFVFENADFYPAATVMTETEKKAQLQEQLSEELREYYLGGNNWQECRDLIDQIEKIAD